MKTEFLQSLIPETVEGRDDIIKKIFAENGKDVEAAKKPFVDFDSIKAQLADAQATIETLKASSGDAAKLRAQLDEYEAKEAQRVEDEKKNAKQRELAQRFATVRGAVEFIDPDIESAILSKFGAALADKANEGKGDAEIYATLTKDKPYFKSQNPPVNMGGVGDVGKAGAVTAEQFAKMGIRERTALQQRDPKQYDLLTKKG